VAEQTVALLLALYRRLIQCDRSVREGKWRKAISGFDTFEVAEKTVGLIGVGTIGRKVAKRFKAFETHPLSRYRACTDIEKWGRSVSLDELLRESDIISIHVPLLEAPGTSLDSVSCR
jgi:phosphoglycerate dehydrogenase-like enzyme